MKYFMAFTLFFGMLSCLISVLIFSKNPIVLVWLSTELQVILLIGCAIKVDSITHKL